MATNPNINLISEAFSNGTSYKFGEVRFAGDKFRLLQHRVVFAIYNGFWPIGVVDHLDGDLLNNHPKNLRDVSQSENRRNSRITRQNTSGVMGVRKRTDRKNRWLSQIKVDGKMIHLGDFDNFDAAVNARKSAEIQYGFSDRHGASH